MKNKVGKKNRNLFLSLIIILVSALTIAFTEYSFGFNSDTITWDNILRAFAQWFFCISFVLCFALKNHSVKLLFILLAAGFSCFVDIYALLTVFSLLLSVWFVQSVKKEKNLRLTLPYFLVNVCAFLLGIIMVLRTNQLVRGEKASFIMAYAFLSIAVGTFLLRLLLVKKNQKSVNKMVAKNKTGFNKQLENYLVYFYFLEGAILLVNVIYWIRFCPFDLFSKIAIIARALFSVYVLLELNDVLKENKSILNRLKALFN